jgi:peptide-methionine (S)-S-oxide reductase
VWLHRPSVVGMTFAALLGCACAGTAFGQPTAERGGTRLRSPGEAGPIETAVFAGGCFWSTEALFERVPGVKNVVSGFAGGVVPSPSYEMVCTGETGHAEAVRVTFDSEAVSYEALLKIFWSVHDPTTPNRQGEDEGPQYRSMIFYRNDAQKKAAHESYRQLKASKTFRAPIVTELVPLTAFYPAEPYHQDYYRHHWHEPYCQTVIEPKLFKLDAKLHPGAHKTRKKTKK